MGQCCLPPVKKPDQDEADAYAPPASAPNDETVKQLQEQVMQLTQMMQKQAEEREQEKADRAELHRRVSSDDPPRRSARQSSLKEAQHTPVAKALPPPDDPGHPPYTPEPTNLLAPPMEGGATTMTMASPSSSDGFPSHFSPQQAAPEPGEAAGQHALGPVNSTGGGSSGSNHNNGEPSLSRLSSKRSLPGASAPSILKTRYPAAPPPPPAAPPLPVQEDGNFAFEVKKYNYNEHTKAPPPDPTRPSADRVRTLLLIGETGSGKSTLINAMANYAAGVQYNDKVRYKLVEEPEKDQAFSQTQTVTSYHVWVAKNSFTLRLIDTPGFGDTSGVERDEAITKEIYEFLQKEDEIHGVCFVAAASLPRLTVTQQYIINKVLTMFGTDAVENIYLLVTFADGKRAQVLSAIKASGFPYNENHGFHFNNSALFAQGADRNEYSRNFWQMGQHSLEKFFLNLSSKEPFNLGKTKDVIATQKKLQNYVASITPQVTIGLSKIDNLKKILDDIKVNRDKINENKDYYYRETIPKVERLLKQPGTYNTQCLKCSYNCHHDCTRSNDDDKQYCCAMDSNGNCTVCPDKCHWTDHANLDYYFEWSVQTVQRQYDTKKLQLTAAKDGLSRSEALKNSILNELQNVYDTVHNLMTSIHQAHAKLDEIALRPTNMKFADYLRLLIEQEKLHKRPGFDGRIEQLHLMLDQAKIRQDIVSNKYDPVKEWKVNVEKELETFSSWEAQKQAEAGPDQQEDAGDDSSSDSDDTSSSGSGGIAVNFHTASQWLAEQEESQSPEQHGDPHISMGNPPNHSTPVRSQYRQQRTAQQPANGGAYNAVDHYVAQPQLSLEAQRIAAGPTAGTAVFQRPIDTPLPQQKHTEITVTKANAERYQPTTPQQTGLHSGMGIVPPAAAGNQTPPRRAYQAARPVRGAPYVPQWSRDLSSTSNSNSGMWNEQDASPASTGGFAGAGPPGGRPHRTRGAAMTPPQQQYPAQSAHPQVWDGSL
ncbi:Dual specificity protein kinase shkE [Diplonema papillatum]|nr:Dual specificity protein kinase shkE [Diplonema papillatum]